MASTTEAIRTKILATMGPATADPGTLDRLVDAGINAARLNFSHGNLEQHAEMLAMVRDASTRAGRPIAVLGDLAGPKIRLNTVLDHGDVEGMPIEIGETLRIARGVEDGKDGRVTTNYKNFVDDVKVGDRVLVEDGLLRFVVTSKDYNELTCQCLVGGVLKTRKGVNLPNTHVNIPSITDKDWQSVDWAIDNDLDYLALSFVRSSADLELLRQHLQNRQSDIQLVSKIEKTEAINDIDAIIDASDGVMVARGDLGVEMDLAQVPIIQKDIIDRCATRGKFVVVATQMLQSMVESATPTRAEVSDVANAIFDGTDVVMLSGETSVGEWPVQSVHIMSHIAGTTERYIVKQESERRSPQTSLKTMQLSAAVANGVRRMIHDLDAALVAVYSQNGATARIFSKNRFPVPIIAMSSDPRALRRMALLYGVIAHEMPPPESLRKLTRDVDEIVLARHLASRGDRIVLVAGAQLGTPGTLNGIVVHTVGRYVDDATQTGEYVPNLMPEAM